VVAWSVLVKSRPDCGIRCMTSRNRDERYPILLDVSFESM
jgi:hypothetical protein